MHEYCWHFRDYPSTFLVCFFPFCFIGLPVSFFSIFVEFSKANTCFYIIFVVGLFFIHILPPEKRCKLTIISVCFALYFVCVCCALVGGVGAHSLHLYMALRFPFCVFPFFGWRFEYLEWEWRSSCYWLHVYCVVRSFTAHSRFLFIGLSYCSEANISLFLSLAVALYLFFFLEQRNAEFIWRCLENLIVCMCACFRHIHPTMCVAIAFNLFIQMRAIEVLARYSLMSLTRSFNEHINAFW